MTGPEEAVEVEAPIEPEASVQAEATEEPKAASDALEDVEAGLDALETSVEHKTGRLVAVPRAAYPPVLAVGLIIAVWQVLYAAKIWPDWKLRLQSLPSVAWVPPALMFFGPQPAMLYGVVLLGAAPSIAVGVVSGLDQVPPLYLRGQATNLRDMR